MQKVEHIGIAVKNLDASNELFSKLFGKEHYKIEAVEREGVKTSFFMMGDTKIELLAASREDSAIAKFRARQIGGVQLQLCRVYW